MNTLISIVMGIVLNLLGVEVQERQQIALLQEEDTIENNIAACEGISEENVKTYKISSINQVECNAHKSTSFKKTKTNINVN